MNAETPRPAVPTLHGPRVTLSEMEPADVDATAKLIATDPRAAAWWSPSAETVKQWLVARGYILVAVDVEAERVGVIGFEEDDDPDYRMASFDIVIYDRFAGHGYGPEALRVLARWLAEERGHHRFHIDPALENTAAIRAYEKVGFRPVGIMRRHQRGPNGVWRDGLLIDLLAEEITSD